jgi:hypothetical protein
MSIIKCVEAKSAQAVKFSGFTDELFKDLVEIGVEATVASVSRFSFEDEEGDILYVDLGEYVVVQCGQFFVYDEDTFSQEFTISDIITPRDNTPTGLFKELNTLLNRINDVCCYGIGCDECALGKEVNVNGSSTYLCRLGAYLDL